MTPGETLRYVYGSVERVGTVMAVHGHYVLVSTGQELHPARVIDMRDGLVRVTYGRPITASEWLDGDKETHR